MTPILFFCLDREEWRTVILNGVPSDAKEEDVQLAFRHYSILSIKLSHRTSKIIFSGVADAQRAYSEIGTSCKICGVNVSVSISSVKKSQNSRSALRVTHIPMNTRPSILEEKLHKLFSRFGYIESIDVDLRLKNAVVVFRRVEDAKEAQKELHHSHFLDEKISVAFIERESRKSESRRRHEKGEEDVPIGLIADLIKPGSEAYVPLPMSVIPSHIPSPSSKPTEEIEKSVESFYQAMGGANHLVPRNVAKCLVAKRNIIEENKDDEEETTTRVEDGSGPLGMGTHRLGLGHSELSSKEEVNTNGRSNQYESFRRSQSDTYHWRIRKRT